MFLVWLNMQGKNALQISICHTIQLNFITNKQTFIFIYQKRKIFFIIKQLRTNWIWFCVQILNNEFSIVFFFFSYQIRSNCERAYYGERIFSFISTESRPRSIWRLNFDRGVHLDKDANFRRIFCDYFRENPLRSVRSFRFHLRAN